MPKQIIFRQKNVIIFFFLVLDYVLDDDFIIALAMLLRVGNVDDFTANPFNSSPSVGLHSCLDANLVKVGIVIRVQDAAN